MARAYEADKYAQNLLAKDNRITHQMAAVPAHATGASNAWTHDANRTCSLATFLNPFYNSAYHILIANAVVTASCKATWTVRAMRDNFPEMEYDAATSWQLQGFEW